MRKAGCSTRRQRGELVDSELAPYVPDRECPACARAVPYVPPDAGTSLAATGRRQVPSRRGASAPSRADQGPAARRTAMLAMANEAIRAGPR